MECLKAAVQNGADAIYVGLNRFSARSSAKNFTLEELKNAIDYAHLRNVKIHLTLNTLVKNNEFNDILSDIKVLYEYGLDAVIVQDLGLAQLLIQQLPELPIHASTQMTIHNLDGVLEAEALGFSRAILSRETSLTDIQYICKHSNIEIEAFIHGALCISYSGQCLFSSLIGSRSGNRGKCAQACRLPYELLEDNKVIDKGYLLSPKDMCGLEYIPSLIECGVASLKIEGRMKNPEYVSIVTRIYRKYIDLFLEDSSHYKILPEDKKALLQVFNRGGFSSGHLNSDYNKDLIFKEKPNNMGIYIGHVSNYNTGKGHVTLTLNDSLSIGDSVSFEGEDYKYTISELMKKNKNLPIASSGETVKIGRMKGNIRIGAKIYKLSDRNLSTFAKTTYQKENKKTKLQCKIDITENEPIKMEIKGIDTFSNVDISILSTIIPTKATHAPITKDRIEKQLLKTGNTPFSFSSIQMNLDENIHLPSISALNDLRRTAIDYFSQKVLDTQKRKPVEINLQNNIKISKNITNNKKISLLLNTIDCDFDYSNLEADRIYLPLHLFTQKKYAKAIIHLTLNFDTYIYLPNIIRNNYKNLVINSIDNIITKFLIKGFVISNLSQFHMLQHYRKYEFIGNYTFNVFNNRTCYELRALDRITLSPELNKKELNGIASDIPTELIVYGRLPVMSCHYCFLGNTNKCYPECPAYCNHNHSYSLKDRLGFLFKIVPDNLQTVTTIYNSKITSFACNDLNVDSLRIDILDEAASEIENIISAIRAGKKMTGNNYTNGNINREV